MFQEELLTTDPRGIRMAICPTCDKELEPGEDCPDCGPKDADEERQGAETGDDADETVGEE